MKKILYSLLGIFVISFVSAVGLDWSNMGSGMMYAGSYGMMSVGMGLLGGVFTY